MKYNKSLILLSILFSACSVFNTPTTTPPPSTVIIHDTTPGQTVYVHDTVPGAPIYVHDTVGSVIVLDSFTVVIHDTIPKVTVITRTVAMPLDTTLYELQIAPESTPEATTEALQAAVNYQQTHHCVIVLIAAQYYTTRTILGINIQGNDYGQAYLNIRGPVPARNTVGTQTAQIYPLFDNGPVFAVQNSKGARIKNIQSGGQYEKAATLSWLSIDTLMFDEWRDNHCSFNRTKPHCFLAIDPFSKPSYYDGIKYQMYDSLQQYYLPGMSQAGSTDLVVEGCLMENYPVCIMETPSMQLNCEMVTIRECQFRNCVSAIAQTQAQAKMNKIVDCMFWGQIRECLDYAHWGFSRGDAVTMHYVNGASVAGYVFEFACGTPINFETAMGGIQSDSTSDTLHTFTYVEGLFRFCDFGGFPANYPQNAQTLTRSGVTFRDSHVDFQTQQAGIPSPEFYVNCAGCVFDGVTMRQYNSTKEADRLPLNNEETVFRNCVLGYYPITARTDPAYYQPTIFENIRLCYMPRYPPISTIVNPASWETQFSIGNHVLYCDRSTFNGYIIDSVHQFQLWDYIIGGEMPIESISAGAVGDQIVGIVNGQRGDTVLLQNMGRLMRTGITANLFVNRLNQ